MSVRLIKSIKRRKVGEASLHAAASRRENPLPWREIPFQPMRHAAQLLGVSVAKVYSLAHAGEIGLTKVAGKTLARTEDIARILDGASAYVPDAQRGKESRAARTERAAGRRCA